MADERIVDEVQRALHEAGVFLEPDARREVARRVEDALPFPNVSGVDEDHVDYVTVEIRRADADHDIARRHAGRLAEALRRRGDGPFSDQDVEFALSGLCPIWPFC